MHIIGTTTILHVPDETNDLSFCFLQPIEEFEHISWTIYLGEHLVDADGKSHLQLEELALERYVRYIRPLFELNQAIHVSGAFPKAVLDDVRERYRERGWHDPIAGTYSPDFSQTVTLSVELANLIYSPDREPTVTLSQWAVRANIAGLNDGVISRVYVKRGDRENLTRYTAQSHLQLQRFARAIRDNWMSLWIECTEFTLRVPPPSWNGVPCE